MMPAVLSTKEAHEYVGNRYVWEELFERYGTGPNPQLKPFRKTPAKGSCFWLRSVVDGVLMRAQLEGALVNEISPTTG